MSATELFIALFRAVKIKDFHWWPAFGSFEVVVGAILIQNTAWRNADAALQNLRSKGLLSLESIARLEEAELAQIIKVSGFYNQKARRLSLLCKAIIADFGDFESFKAGVSREWLLARKGIGAESCDAILCYACERAVMVADSYSARLLGALGYEFESYDELSAWLGELEFERIYELVSSSGSAAQAQIYSSQDTVLREADISTAKAILRSKDRTGHREDAFGRDTSLHAESGAKTEDLRCVGYGAAAEASTPRANKQSVNDENGVYALFHGLIVEFCKAHLRGKIFDDFAMEFFNNLK